MAEPVTFIFCRGFLVFFYMGAGKIKHLFLHFQNKIEINNWFRALRDVSLFVAVSFINSFFFTFRLRTDHHERQSRCPCHKIHRQAPNWSSCLCPVTSSSSQLTPFTAQSWVKLHESAEQHQDAVYDQLKGHWDDGPAGGYHRECYQSYTSKTLIKKLLVKRESQEQPSTSKEVDSNVRGSRSANPAKLPDWCIFCQQKLRRIGKNPENLTQCLTTQASQKLMKAAENKEDHNILLQIRGQDLIAIEVKYHKSCYKSYTRNVKSRKQEDSEGDDGYQSAFTQLVAVVQEKIIDGLDVCKMTDLQDTYIDLLDEIGIDTPNYRTEKLKARLQKHFGDRLRFWQPQQRAETEIVFSKTVSMGQAVEAVVTAVKMISSSGDDVPVRLAVEENEYNKAHQVFRCAQIIRGELLTVRNTMACP